MQSSEITLYEVVYIMNELIFRTFLLRINKELDIIRRPVYLVQKIKEEKNEKNYFHY